MASIENKLISQDAIFVSNWIMLDLRFAWFKIMILTLIIKCGIGIRILKHDSDFELKNAQFMSIKIFLLHYVGTEVEKKKNLQKMIYKTLNINHSPPKNSFFNIKTYHQFGEFESNPCEVYSMVFSRYSGFLNQYNWPPRVMM